MENYTYLFPFERVKQNSRVIIYGAGEVGLSYLKQVLTTDYCEVVAIIDKNYKEYGNLVCPVLAPSSLSELEYDQVIIAMKTGRHLDEIRRILQSYGVDDDRIIVTLTRKDVSVYAEKAKSNQGCAYSEAELSIMINFDGGIGDNISRAAFIYSLIDIVPNCLIDLFRVSNVEFARFLFSECRNVNLISSAVGEGKKYTVAFDGIPRSIQVTWFDEQKLSSKYPDLYKKIKRLVEINVEEHFSWSIPTYVNWKRYLYLGKNYYSGLDCQEIFDIDRNVNIPLTQKGKELFESYGIKKYLAICSGNGVSTDTSLISKAWPESYFVQLIKLIHEQLPEFKIVQIDSRETPEIEGADLHILGQPYEMIAWLLKNATLMISIEGGMVHLASQIGTKCVVLFGPTSIEYLGYENNINICSHTCDPCFGLYDRNNICAKKQENPECMYSIKPEMVFRHVKEYLSGVE